MEKLVLRNRADLLLALLYAEESPSGLATAVKGITRLEKLVFLLKMEAGLLRGVKSDDDFHFIPFRMGPWTQEVYDEVDFLESLGLLTKEGTEPRSIEDKAHDDMLFGAMILDKYQKSSSPVSDEKNENFGLTEKGKQKAKEVWDRLGDDEKKKIMGIKKRFNNMNLRQFLRYVYNKYPSYTSESEIKQYLGVE